MENSSDSIHQIMESMKPLKDIRMKNIESGMTHRSASVDQRENPDITVNDLMKNIVSEMNPGPPSIATIMENIESEMTHRSAS
jgi:hypothetical protein